jgi:GLPGLI family protein
MKRLIFLFVTVLFSNIVFGQANDSIIATIYYSAFYTKDSVSKNREYEDFELNIGHNITKYHSYTKFKRDSILQEAEKKGGKPPLELKGVLMTNCSDLIIYRSRETDSVIVFTTLVGDKFYFDDSYKQVWQILPDTVNILGYSCQKAKTTFRGRQYIVYFNNSIPISSGPWKFTGLPGLILKATDTNGFFGFEATSIAYNKKGIVNPMAEKKNYLFTTRKRFMEQEELYFQNPVEYLRTVKGYNFIIKGDQNTQTKPPPLRQELF